MTLLSLENVSKSFGERLLFEDVAFGLERGERVGIIGVNGSGKSTLLRIIAGQEPPDSGQVVMSRGSRVAFLPQNPALDEHRTVLETLFADNTPVNRLLRAYEQTSHALAHTPDDAALLAQLSDLTTQMDTLQAWDVETAAHATLTSLGLQEHLDRPVGILSGGQRKRVAMAQALLMQPDLLICDEPTNHIDTETIAWLEAYFIRTSVALLLVTHDRYFLDRIVSRMIEIDHGKTYTYEGNYTSFLEQKAAREMQAVEAEESRQNLLRKELAWLRRGARARTTKQKAHVQRVHDLMEQTPGPTQKDLTIDAGARRIGKRVLELEHISKSYNGDHLVRDFSLSLRRDDRLGIIGPNGSGKTTLLNMIAGRVAPDSGQVVLGETVHIGYYDQESEALDPSLRVIDYVREAAELVRGADGALVAASQMLERFLFSHKAQWAYISTLSGGERRRLYLLRTLMFAPNLLLLDEPTNDLDIQTLGVLEDYLDTFQGAVIVVSHDRYFLDRTAEHLLAFKDDGTIQEYPGGYSVYAEYRAREQEEEAAQAAAAARPKAPTTPAPRAQQEDKPRRLSYKERRELQTLEKRVDELETRKQTLSEQINQVGDDYQRYQELAAALTQLEADLEAAVERWATLAEIET
jgi:ATP-binding cassette subfamily F protein uup